LPAVQASGRQRRSCWQKLTSLEGLTLAVSALRWLYVPALNAKLVRGVPCLRRLRAAVACAFAPTAAAQQPCGLASRGSSSCMLPASCGRFRCLAAQKKARDKGREQISTGEE
jgi:hypothetical protein